MLVQHLWYDKAVEYLPLGLCKAVLSLADCVLYAFAHAGTDLLQPLGQFLVAIKDARIDAVDTLAGAKSLAASNCEP